MSVDLAAKLQRRLEEKANPKTKAWWEKYLKHAIQFRAVKMAEFREALRAWIEAQEIEAELSLAERGHLVIGINYRAGVR